MSLIKSLFLSSFENPSINNPNFWLADYFGSRKTSSGERVTPENATSLSTYYAIIRCISEDIGKLPMILYRRTSDDNRERAKDHPLYKLIRHSPNPYMSAMSFRETMTACAIGWGGGYAEIQRDAADRATGLFIIHPRNVTVKIYPDGEPYYIVKHPNGGEQTLSAFDVFHLHGIGGDGFTGWSLLKCAAEAIGLGLALQKFGAAFFGNGANIGGVLEHPKVLKKEAKDYLRSSWEELHSGADNAHKIAVLEEGMKWTKIGIPPEEAQFLGARGFSVVDLCRYGRIPPHKVQHLENATYSNIESQSIEYLQDCLFPWLVRWEEEVWRKLIPVSEQDTYFSEHLVDALMRADSAARGAFYREMLNTGVMSPNDVRRRENMNPIGPEGDAHYIQGAMVPLSMAAKGPQKPEAQKPMLSPSPAKDEVKSSLDSAQRKVFFDAARRVVRKECMAILRMGKKHKSIQAFRDDLGKFHAEQRVYFVETFQSLILTSLKIERLDEAAESFCREMAIQAESSFACGVESMENDARQWEEDFPALIVSGILGEEKEGENSPVKEELNALKTQISLLSMRHPVINVTMPQEKIVKRDEKGRISSIVVK